MPFPLSSLLYPFSAVKLRDEPAGDRRGGMNGWQTIPGRRSRLQDKTAHGNATWLPHTRIRKIDFLKRIYYTEYIIIYRRVNALSHSVRS